MRGVVSCAKCYMFWCPEMLLHHSCCSFVVLGLTDKQPLVNILNWFVSCLWARKSILKQPLPERHCSIYCCMLNFSPLAHFELALESPYRQSKWCYVYFDVVPRNKDDRHLSIKWKFRKCYLHRRYRRLYPQMMSSPVKDVCLSVRAPYQIRLTGTVTPSCQNQSGKTKLLMRKETHFVIRVPPKSDIQFQSGHISSHCLSSPIY